MTEANDDPPDGYSLSDDSTLAEEVEEVVDLSNLVVSVEGAEPPGVRLVNRFLSRMIEERFIELAIPAVDGKRGSVIRGKSESGEWSDFAEIPKAFLSNVVNRLKVMSDIDPIAHLVARTGSFTVKFRAREADFETEFHPKAEGGDTQLRSRLPG